MEATAQGNQPLVLIIDHQAFNRQQLRLLLEQSGYQVAEAKDGTEAINVFQQLHPDLVLLDAILPDMDEFECCAKLLSIKINKYIKVLMITVIEDTESVEDAFRAGAADYVIKPFYWPVLRQRIKRLIEESQLHQKLVTANQELQRLVTIDFLTQVANRRWFEEYIEQEWRRMARLQQPLSLILLDVDFFKSYNDTYGHQLGDSVLIEIAKAIRYIVQRPGDLVARYGGEEFAVILPNTDVLGSTEVGQRIYSAIQRLAIPHQNSLVSSHITLSAGLATVIPKPGSNFEEIIAAADKALYQAKSAGRDCFEHNNLLFDMHCKSNMRVLGKS
ncbi:PleD family two-component system response regulator [Brasilonema sp. CT11]|nr:PleD family two-component system response regulator [Brasilonema sp. CT11]